LLKLFSASAETTLNGQTQQGHRWRIILGYSEKFGANIRPQPTFCLMLNGKVLLFQSEKNLEKYRRGREENIKFSQTVVAKAEEQDRLNVETARANGATERQLGEIPRNAARSAKYLPHPWVVLNDLPMAVFEYSQTQIEDLIQTKEKELLADFGLLPNVPARIPIWEGCSGFQPVIEVSWRR
jgi:hypothetical protein